LRVGLYGDIASVDDASRHSWQIYCLSKTDGKVLWDKVACAGVPKIRRHPKSSHANSTPATDGTHVVALFGSEGLYCWTVDGKLLWKKDLGRLDSGYWKVPKAQWAFGSSPIIYKGLVIVQCDVQNNPFLAAYDVTSGKQVWHKKRREVCTWSTPTIHEGPKRTELIVNGFWHIGGYDPQTGKELWKLDGGADIPVPTPFVAHDLIYITSSHSKPRPIYAIRVGATGDITLKQGEQSSDHIAWSLMRRGTYMQTPIVYGDYLYTCTDRGVLTCYEARTGKEVYRKRIDGGGGGFTASAVAADGKLYYTGEDGDIYVLEAGPDARHLATNSMGEICMATPAISNGHIFIRTQHHVFCIGN
jgi:outer membrane protein assembly factor BamB